jgi:hypothetical protein
MLPTDILSTPVLETPLTVFKLIFPEASVV